MDQNNDDRNPLNPPVGGIVRGGRSRFRGGGNFGQRNESPERNFGIGGRGRAAFANVGRRESPERNIVFGGRGRAAFDHIGGRGRAAFDHIGGRGRVAFANGRGREGVLNERGDFDDILAIMRAERERHNFNRESDDESPVRPNFFDFRVAESFESMKTKVYKQEEGHLSIVEWPCGTLREVISFDNPYTSDSFALSNCPSVEFTLSIDSSNFPISKISLAIKEKPDEEPISLNVKFWLKLNDGDAVFNERTDNFILCKVGDKFEFETSVETNASFSDLLTRNSPIDSDKMLKICCKIGCLSAVFKAPDDLSKSLWKLYEDGQGHDIVIEVEGKEFKVLSAVFTSQSDVFSSMFSADYVEGQDKKVVIEDASAEAFEAFVRWMYIKEIRNLNMLEELYVLANRYLVPALKLQCANLMISIGLNENNAARRFSTFIQYEEKALAEQVMKFIFSLEQNQTRKIFESKDWAEYLMIKYSTSTE